MEINYTDEVLKLDLMHHMGYDGQQAAQLVEFYKRNNKLAELTAAIEEKKNDCSRLAGCI